MRKNKSYTVILMDVNSPEWKAKLASLENEKQKKYKENDPTELDSKYGDIFKDTSNWILG